MIKYTDYDIVFQEIPDETTLAINISGCPNRCPGCHSPELWEDIGTNLDLDELVRLVNKYDNITCVCFMGGDKNPFEIKNLIKMYHVWYENRNRESFWSKSFKETNRPIPKILPKFAWYSGQSDEDKAFDCFSYDYEYRDQYIFVTYDRNYIRKHYYKERYNLQMFDYIKLGPYIEELGPLNNPNTNQRLYKVEGNQLIDITNKFWK